MNNFSFYNPGKLLFGQDMGDEFATVVANSAHHVLVICGGHFKRSGELKLFKKLLQKHGIGVEARIISSSTLENLNTLASFCREALIDGVVGVGGAMVMDLSKLVAYAAVNEGDLWPKLSARDDASGRKLFTATVPTYPSSGSELDGACEIINEQTNTPGGFYGDCLIPDLTWLNPCFTLSIAPLDLCYGMLASYVQTSLAYMNPYESPLAEWMGLGLLESIERNLEIALAHPQDLESRGQLMLCSCLSGYGLPYMGKGDVDFSLYTLEGYLEEVCGLSYTRALVTLFPFWLLHAVHAKENVHNQAFDRYCRACFNTRESAFDSICEKWRHFNIPLTLSKMSPQVPFDLEKFRSIAQQNGPLPCSFGELSPDTLLKIAKMASGYEF